LRPSVVSGRRRKIIVRWLGLVCGC
jgi:hypothetical protein